MSVVLGMRDLITRQLMAEATPEEQARLHAWRWALAENEATYRRLRKLWELLGAAQSYASSRRPTAEEIVARAGVREFPVRHENAPAPGRRRNGPSRVAKAIVAATALAAAAAASVLFVVRSFETSAETRFSAVEFITGPAETTTVRLDDGTVVRLAPGSRLEVDNRATRERRVTFDGVGYFAVAKDATRPFIIHTRNGDAHVLGTRFELRTEDTEMRVVVVEGRVALEAGGGRTEVAASQMGRAGVDRAPTVVDVENVEEFIGWVSGMFVFQSTPLEAVARDLARHYGVTIDIRNPELAKREVTAWLREQSFDAAMTAVCGAVGAACSIGSDHATMWLPPQRGR